MRRTLSAVVAAAFVCFAILPLAAAPVAPLDALAAYSGASPSCRAALEQALDLMAKGKWRSALAVLDAFDPNNADPYSLAMKTKLFLDGYIRSDMHRSFEIRDLGPGEDVATLRQTEQDGDLIAFDPQTLVEAQASAKTVVPAVLSKELGDYYYDVQLRWSGQWLESDEAIYTTSLENYQKAYEGGIYDADSLQNQGEILMRFERAAEAEPLFGKSVELDPAKAASRYNFAICLMLIGKKVAALDQLDKAIDLLPNPSSRFEAIALGARTAAEAGDALRSESYLARGEELLPQDPSPGLLRHYIAVEYQDAAAADAAADGLMSRYSNNPSVIRALISTWYGSGKQGEAQAFLERTIARTSDDLSLGALKFYIAVLLSQGEPAEAERTRGLSMLAEAEEHMKKASPDDEAVFQAIAGVRARLESAP